MVHHFLFTDQVSTITTSLKQLIHQARFALGLNGLHRHASEPKNQRFMALWKITLQNAPESSWPWITQKSRQPDGLFVGADFLLGHRS